MNKFDGLITLKDASVIFSRAESTLKESIRRGYFKVDKDCKKFGTVWVFDISALEKRYGKLNDRSKGCIINSKTHIKEGDIFG